MALLASTAVAGLGTFWAQYDTLDKHVRTYLRDREYRQTLKHPFADVLDEATLKDWPTGKLTLAQFQIDAYLGRMKTAPSWIKLCLTDKAVFPDHYSSQYNYRLDLSETFADRQNKILLQKVLDQNEAKEDPKFLAINDPFRRLLKRASKQLLSRHKESELPKIHESELYLLRNAIYGQHGRPFSTSKLQKYAYRMGWGPLQAAYDASSLSAVELCNAFFLEQLHPKRELGAVGRGVLIRYPTTPTFPRMLKSALCTCLGKPQYNVDCHENRDADNSSEFREYVDFIIEFLDGDADKSEWTFLAEESVVPDDRESFRTHQDKFDAAALDFNVAVQAPFRSRNIDFSVSGDAKTAPFWGTRITVSQASAQRMRADPVFLHEVSKNICTSTHAALELAGPYVPHTVPSEPASRPVDMVQQPAKVDAAQTVGAVGR